MRRLPVLVAAAALLAAPAAHAADRTLKLTPTTQTLKWEGARASGVFAVYSGFLGQPCTKAPVMYCDETEIEIEFPEKVNNASLSIGNLGNGTDDFDVYLHRINPDGSVGEQVAYSNNVGPRLESLGWNIARGGVVDSRRWLLKIPYYSVMDASYTATATVFGLTPPAEPAPDDPPDDTPQNPPPGDADQSDDQQDPPKDDKKDEPPKTTTTTTQSSTGTSSPSTSTSTSTSQASPTWTPTPPPAAEPPPRPSRLWVVSRRGSRAVVRLRCRAACAATVRGGSLTSLRLTLAAGDTRELTLPARRGATVVAVVRPRRGGRAFTLRAR